VAADRYLSDAKLASLRWQLLSAPVNLATGGYTSAGQLPKDSRMVRIFSTPDNPPGQPANTSPGFVAEVWLAWPVCRGSTMYRVQARTKHGACLKAKIAALKVDWLLPRSYLDTDWSGRPCRYEYEFGIHYGVRELSARERTEGVQAFTGGSPLAHPSRTPFRL
jgi:hypothetical protein